MTVHSHSQSPQVFLLLSALLLCSFKFKACGADLKTAWDIQGPVGMKCLLEGDIDILRTDHDSEYAICDDASSVVRLDYTIHKNAKYPKYQIFQKECLEPFEPGTEPMRGTTPPNEDNTISLTVSSASNDDDTASASLEISPSIVLSGSSWWWQRFRHVEKEHQTFEFCIRMGLWLPPAAGAMEVNFRETNVAVTFNKTASDKGDNYMVDSVVINPKELVGISVNLMGSTGTKRTKAKNEDDIGKGIDSGRNDEL